MIAASSKTKRPGSVAALAEPVSPTNLAKGKQMNQHATIPTDQPATVAMVVDPSKLQHLSMEDLFALHNAIDSIAEIASAIGCRPCFYEGTEQNVSTTGAGKLINQLVEFIDDYKSAIRDAAEAYEPADPDEANKRAWVMIKHEASISDDLGEFLALSASLAAYQFDVERRARLPKARAAA
jgi:hypothetical protein